MKHPKSILSETFHFRRRKREIDFEKILLEIVKSPVFKYVSIGLTAAILTRYAKKVQDDYPELSEFINQNLALFEEKINALKTKIYTKDFIQ